MSEVVWKYPPIEPYHTGWLTVSTEPFHSLYWEEYGNREGEPILFLHGGPGGGTAPYMARVFDPARYRIILFDQRGCGKSIPSAAEGDATAALAANTTSDLVNDIVKLREALTLTSKMHVFGGSWGSTLALAYAIEHAETVQTLVLRGIFLCRKKDIDYFYQGNASLYDQQPTVSDIPGAYLFYPETWKQFVEIIPAEERGDMIKAYAKIFSSTPQTEAEYQYLLAAATAWSVWEGVTSFLECDEQKVKRFADPEFAKAFARIENHYFMNGAFLGGSGEECRNQNYLLENIEQIKNIPIHIVHGRYDQVCPLFQAEELVAALKKVNARTIDYRITLAGHSLLEHGNCKALTDIMDHLPLVQ
ncbi:MAG: prolyl aminopeptidase [Pseudomonadota bacterium]